MGAAIRQGRGRGHELPGPETPGDAADKQLGNRLGSGEGIAGSIQVGRINLPACYWAVRVRRMVQRLVP